MKVLPPDHGTPIGPGSHKARVTQFDVLTSAPQGNRLPGVMPPKRETGPVYPTNEARSNGKVQPLPPAPPAYLVNRHQADRAIARQRQTQRIELARKYRNPYG